MEVLVVTAMAGVVRVMVARLAVVRATAAMDDSASLVDLCPTV